MASLYDAGWRQGSVLRADLQAATTVLAEGGVRSISRSYGIWMVVTQDCDLADRTDDDGQSEIELRPLFSTDGPAMLGIRSRKLRVSPSRAEYLLAESPRCMISPAALTHLLLSGVTREEWLSDDELLALKTWLGLRYDRPAVPETLVGLARSIADRIHERRNRPALLDVKDVLVQFDVVESPPLFRFVAIIASSADRDAVRDLLIEAGAAVPTHLGVLNGVEVGTVAEVSIEVLATSYAADLSQITWRTGRPTGAA